MKTTHGGKRDNRKKKADDRRGGRRIPGPGKTLGRPRKDTRMFNLGDEVQVNHEGDKDDGMIGNVEQIDGTRYRVYFGPQDGGGWYDEDELKTA